MAKQEEEKRTRRDFLHIDRAKVPHDTDTAEALHVTENALTGTQHALQDLEKVLTTHASRRRFIKYAAVTGTAVAAAEGVPRLMGQNEGYIMSGLGYLFGWKNKRATNDAIGAMLEDATAKYNLPKLDSNVISSLKDAAQAGAIDHTEIIFKSVDGNNYVLLPKAPRDLWYTASLIDYIKNDSNFDILKHPEMLPALNQQVIVNNWSIFDNPYGVGSNTSHQDALELMNLQWKLYSQAAPQRGGESMVYNRDFPWYDAKQLNGMYEDKNEMKAALFNLFNIPGRTISIKDSTRDNAKIVTGVEGARIGLTQAQEEYQAALKYPKSYAKDAYTQWLTDRFNHGLNNTVGQFLGFTDVDQPSLKAALEKTENGTDVYAYKNLFGELKANRSGPNQFLEGNWKYWDTVDSIVGYVRSHPKVGELEGIQYVIPATLKQAGFPINFEGIDPAPAGTGPEWAVGLPPYIAKSVNAKLGPGYAFGLYSMSDGLTKDGVKVAGEIFGDRFVRTKI